MLLSLLVDEQQDSTSTLSLLLHSTVRNMTLANVIGLKCIISSLATYLMLFCVINCCFFKKE